MTTKGNRPLTTAEEIREATREAHQALKDLRAERRALAEDLAAARASAERMVGEAVAKELADLGPSLEKFVADAKAAVFARFDRIADVLTFRDPESRRQGKVPMEDLARAAAVMARVGAVAGSHEVTLDDGRVALVVEV